MDMRVYAVRERQAKSANFGQVSVEINDHWVNQYGLTGVLTAQQVAVSARQWLK